MTRAITSFCIFVVFLSLSFAKADWYQVETENFIITGDTSSEALEGFAIELEQFQSFMGALTTGGVNRETSKVPVLLVSSPSTFEKIVQIRDAAGVYTNRISSPVFVGTVADGASKSAIRGEGRDKFRWAKHVIKHEYVHHYTYKYGPTYYPIWYREGLAEYLATFRMKDGIGELGLPPSERIPSLAYQNWEKWENVLGATQRWSGNAGGDLLYAQSWLATHYIRHNPDYAGKLEPYLASIRIRPDDGPAIFEESFGVSPQKIGREIRSYYRRNEYKLLSIDLSRYISTPTLETRKLDDWESEFEIAFIRRFFVKTDESRESLLAELLELNIERPDDARVLKELSYLYFSMDRLDDARATTKRLEALVPNDVDTLILQGLTGPASDARAKFDLARQMDPTNARAHHEYAKTYLNTGRIPQSAISAARSAMKYSSTTVSTPLVAGALFAQAGNVSEARRILEPLAVWPTSESARKRAQAILNSL